jgi:hypothetical protein
MPKRRKNTIDALQRTCGGPSRQRTLRLGPLLGAVFRRRAVGTVAWQSQYAPTGSHGDSSPKPSALRLVAVIGLSIEAQAYLWRVLMKYIGQPLEEQEILGY